MAKKVAIKKSCTSPFSMWHEDEMMNSDEVDAQTDEEGHWFAIDPIDHKRYEILAPTLNCGGMKPLATEKEAAVALGATYLRISDNRDDPEEKKQWKSWGEQVLGCYGHPVFIGEATKYGGDRVITAQVIRCHDPLCPICSEIAATQRSRELMIALETLPFNCRALMLTLTVPNVTGIELRPTLIQMNKAFDAMRDQSWWKDCVLGYYRSSEITVTKNFDLLEAGRLWHPHMHVLIIVPSSYFRQLARWEQDLKELFEKENWVPGRKLSRCHTVDEARDKVIALIDERMELPEGARPRRIQSVRNAVTRMASMCTEPREFARQLTDAVKDLYIDEKNTHLIGRTWAELMGLDIDCAVVDLRAVTTRNGQTVKDMDPVAMRGAVAEAAKYICKSGDVVIKDNPNESEKRVSVLRKAIAGIKMRSSGGIVRTALAEIRTKTKEEKDIKLDNRERYLLFTRWSASLHAYIIDQRIPLTWEALEILEEKTKRPVSKRLRALCAAHLAAQKAAEEAAAA